MPDPTPQAALVSLLAWYREMGADIAVAETTVDWREVGDRAPGQGWRASVEADQDAAVAASPVGLARPAPLPAQSPAPSPAASPIRPVRTPAERPTPAAAPARQLPTASPDAAETDARRRAAAAGDLAALEATLRGFDGCALKTTAKNLCFYRGAPSARLMLIGEAPGREEDLEGRPFVGRAGQLLDRMLAAAAISADEVHITNIVYWRPPGNRTPTPQEAQICRPFLERQVALVDPDVLVLLGGVAAKHVLDVPEGILKLRGKWRDVALGGRPRRTLATLHPAYLLRTPAQKRLAWRDLLTIIQHLETLPPRGR